MRFYRGNVRQRVDMLRTNFRRVVTVTNVDTGNSIRRETIPDMRVKISFGSKKDRNIVTL